MPRGPSYAVAKAREGKAGDAGEGDVENRRRKQKGDAVQSVAGSVDTVNLRNDSG